MGFCYHYASFISFKTQYKPSTIYKVSNDSELHIALAGVKCLSNNVC